jgi:CRISPR-associated endonuclease Cas1
MGWRKRSRAARHPINAMLNYGYGILISQLQAQVSSAGLDPTIGMIHGNSENRIPLIYDLMEPLRPVVDSHILGLALEHTFSPGDFTINKSGGCRLNPQMAKTLVKQLDFPEAELVVRDFVSNLMRRAK